MNKLLAVIYLFLLSACYQKQKKDEKINYYYDLEGFLEELYQQKQANFLKTTLIEKQKQQKKVENIAWQKELAFLEQANINKSAYRGLYEEVRKQHGDTLILQYKPKNNDLKVRWLEIKLNALQKPLEINAFLQTENYLYASEKELRLWLKDEKIFRYSIKGKQKMIFAKPENFEIYAEKL